MKKMKPSYSPLKCGNGATPFRGYTVTYIKNFLTGLLLNPCFSVSGITGFEPVTKESKSFVLPLHYIPTCPVLYHRAYKKSIFFRFRALLGRDLRQAPTEHRSEHTYTEDDDECDERRHRRMKLRSRQIQIHK